MKDYQAYDFPLFAISQFAYGEPFEYGTEEQNEADQQSLETFEANLCESYPRGYITEFPDTDKHDFCAHPCFGLPTETTELRVYSI